MFHACEALDENYLHLGNTSAIENGVAMFSGTNISENFFGENPNVTFPHLCSAKRMFQNSNVAGSLHIDFTK